jgi:TolA-binding protein
VTKALLWLLLIAFAATAAIWLRQARRSLADRRRAEEARAAEFMAQAVARPQGAARQPSPQERLLFDAAAKAGEAGEAAIAIQLLARLVARYPDGALDAQARSAVEAHKGRLATARAPGTDGPG